MTKRNSVATALLVTVCLVSGCARKSSVEVSSTGPTSLQWTQSQGAQLREAVDLYRYDLSAATAAGIQLKLYLSEEGNVKEIGRANIRLDGAADGELYIASEQRWLDDECNYRIGIGGASRAGDAEIQLSPLSIGKAYVSAHVVRQKSTIVVSDTKQSVLWLQVFQLRAPATNQPLDTILEESKLLDKWVGDFNSPQDAIALSNELPGRVALFATIQEVK